MSEFELLVIPVGVILGLGVTRILGGVIYAIRHRDRSRPHWISIAWGMFIFMHIIGFFNVLWEINNDNAAWTWPIFSMQLTYAVLLFLSAGLVISSDELALELGMEGDFERHGRLALVPFGISFAAAIPFNKWGGGPDWISAPNLLTLVLLALVILAFRASRRLWRGVATIAFGLVSAYGWLFVFAGPGD